MPADRPGDWRFEGRIAGLGSTSGVRVVIGRWDTTPMGSFADVMVEDQSGHRVLLAPNDDVAELLQQTYRFDEVVLGPVAVADTEAGWRVTGPGLEAWLDVGSRTPIGWLLSRLPRRLATAPRWLTVINPAAQIILKGVKTRGSAGQGRTEFYGAYDVRAVVAAGGRWRETELGTLTRVDPPVRFGFGSTPAVPAVTSLITTIRPANSQKRPPD